MKRANTTYILLGLFLLLTSCSSKNIIEGHIGYPSDYVPEVEVYLENIESGVVYRQTIASSFDGESKYIFEDIPDGKYIAYAVPTEEDLEGLIGGYTYAVTCGLKVECEDHDYIHLDVEDGAHLKNINIYDWYMGDDATAVKQYYI